MPAKAKAPSPEPSPASRLGGWVRQGVESFVAAQKILLDLTAQQNALVIGMVRETLSKPIFRPDLTFAKMADKGMANVTAAGKILLDLAAGEAALLADGVKEGLRLPTAAGAVANVVRHRVTTLIDMQKHLLDAAAEQTHEVAESYQKGKGLAVGASIAEMARRGIEDFVATEKRFLDSVAHEVTAATKAGKEAHKPAEERTKVLAHLAREGVEKYIDAQKKLLHLAIEQMEATGEDVGERISAVRKEAGTYWGELTEKSVHNLVKAQKSLMDLAVKPVKVLSAKEETRKVPAARPRRKREHIATHEAA